MKGCLVAISKGKNETPINIGMQVENNNEMHHKERVTGCIWKP